MVQVLSPGEAFLPDTGRAPVTIDATKMVDPPRTYDFVVLEGILESNLDIIHTRTKARECAVRCAFDAPLRIHRPALDVAGRTGCVLSQSSTPVTETLWCNRTDLLCFE